VPGVEVVADMIISEIQYPMLPISKTMNNKPPRTNLIIMKVPE
jgi:hypothetical protein